MKIVSLTMPNGYKENIMERVSGEQLKQTIDLLSSNYTKEEIIKMYNSQLTTKQLGEVVRQMLNDVKYDNTPKIKDISHVGFYQEAPQGLPENFLMNIVKQKIDDGITIEGLKRFLDDNTGVHTNC